MDTKTELWNLISERTARPVEKISENLDFETDLNLSRDELIEFIAHVEQSFGIQLNDENLSEVRTVGDLHEFVLDHLDEI
ncbi:MAG: acyl carrier protein [Patescibacteria group bacterium]|nr:acyl carrier protein [Patescibacteria group bacterium]